MGASCTKQEQRVSTMEEGSLVRITSRDDPDDGTKARRKRQGSSLRRGVGVLIPKDETENSTMTFTNNLPNRCEFDELSDEILLHILSFVSYAPFEVGVVVGWEDGRKRLGCSTSATWTPDTTYDSQQKFEAEHKKLIQEYCDSEKENNNANVLRRALLECEQSQASSSTSSGFFSRFVNYYDNNNNSARCSLTKNLPSLLVEQPERFGTLTHVLPLVSKRWHSLTTTVGGMVLWMEALERNLRHSAAWERGFDAHLTELLLAVTKPECFTATLENGKETASASKQELERSARVLSTSCDDLWESTSSDSFDARELYRNIRDKRQVRLPIFRRVTAITKYVTSMGLFLFEPRYRFMIREAMAHRSEQECRGHAIAATRPRFLFAAFANARHAALLVEIWSCDIRPDGTAEVMVRPVSDHPLVAMVDVHERPDLGGLEEATLVLANSFAGNSRAKTLPAFFMSATTYFLSQNEIFLRFFEGRYKLLIAEIMRDRSDDERQGRAMNAPFPQFLFVSNAQSLEARILDVAQCTIHPDGSADLVCRPAYWVAICSKTMRPGSGGLFDATVLLPSTE